MSKYNVGLIFFFVIITAIAVLCFLFIEQTQGGLLIALAAIGSILTAYLLGQFVGGLASPKNKNV